MEGDLRCVELKRSDSCGFGFSVFGGRGSDFPPVVYDIIANSPASLCGQIEAGDIILEVNDKEVVSFTTKEVLKCLRLSEDLVTLKVKKDSVVKRKIQTHMAASKEMEKLVQHDDRVAMGDGLYNQQGVMQTNGNARDNDENIPPTTLNATWTTDDNNECPDSDPEEDGSQSNKAKTKQKPRFEAFMMTGDLIINLNARSSNASTNKHFDSLSFGQSSTPASPEESDYRLRSKATKREASTFHSPVAEKKGSFSYNSSFRTSKSEDQIQHTSLSTVNIDIEEDMASSLNTLLDTKTDQNGEDPNVSNPNVAVAPVVTSPTRSVESPSSRSSLSESSSSTASPTKFSSPQKQPNMENMNGMDPNTGNLIYTGFISRGQESENESSSELISAMTNSEDCDQMTATVSDASSPLDNTSPEEGSLRSASVWKAGMVTDHNFAFDTVVHSDQLPAGFIASTASENGVTKIVIDDNKVSVHVRPPRLLPGSPLGVKGQDPALQHLVGNPHNGSKGIFNPPLTQAEEEGVQAMSKAALGDDDPPTVTASPPTDDESDIDSLHSFHYSPKAIDMPSASRLAKRLYNLEGFKKSDVSRHLSKNNDFSRVVAEEYLKFFDFTGDALDAALRKFLKQFCLIGETQERERVLAHFSKRFLDCNPGSFRSQDAVHTLTCALMLLNTDLHGDNVGRKMTCGEFIENLAELNDGENFPREILKALYHSIKTTLLEWAIDDDDDIPGVPDTQIGSQENRQGFIAHNPFLEVPNPHCATEYKKGYVMRKSCMESNGKRTPLGKRGWKMYYATLRDLVLYLHKDEHGFRKNQLYDSLHNSIRVHHALASKANDYNKKQHVFRLQTADQAEFLFQTGDSKELQSWVDTINFVAASLSSPALASAVGSQNKFQKPLLPVSHTKLNLREQLQDHENRIVFIEKELEEHVNHAPERGAKSRLVHDYMEKETYLQYEMKRIRTYAYLLRTKMAQFPELEPPLVETSIGEVEEPVEKCLGGGVDPSSNAVWYNNPGKSESDSATAATEKASAKRSLTDRYSYRAAIYKNSIGEECG